MTKCDSEALKSHALRKKSSQNYIATGFFEHLNKEPYFSMEEYVFIPCIADAWRTIAFC